MSEPSIFFSEVNERQGVFTRRAFLMGGLTGAGLVALGGQLIHLQLVEANRYSQLAESNKFNFRLVPPPRGLILDRNGVTLASNRPNFRLLVAKDGDMDVETTVTELSNLVPIDGKRRDRLIKDINRAPKRSPVSVMEDMTWEEFSRVNVRAPELPGVTADMGEVRVYPHGGAFAHVIGYVAKVNDKDVKNAGPNPDPLLYNPGFRIGRQGIEKAFDIELRGKPGAQKQEVDAKGRVVRQDPRGDIAPTPGKEIRLTIDVDVQERALEVFGEQSGAAVVMDCRTGDLLCLLSAPSFDANRFVRGLTVPEYKALSEYERKPLLDKALSGNYPPGSTFKTMTALAALESGMVKPEDHFICTGAWWFGGRYFHCWKKDGHGAQDMHNAIKNSCDCYFYQVALKIGPDRIAKVAGPFGIGQTFDIGITGQIPGILPSTDWVRTHRQDKVWHPGESPSYGIGQGLLSVNPLQLCVMTARLANGRKALNPRLVKSIGGVEMPSGSAAPDLPFAPEHIDIIRAGMAAVANDVTGGAFRQSQLGLGPIKMAGKTGTAQSHDYKEGVSRKSSSFEWSKKDHNWFIAFAPFDAPRYALALLVEHGGGSGATEAAPRAREIMRTVLLKDPELRSLIEKPLPLPEADPSSDTEGVAPDLPDATPPSPPPGAPT